MNANNTSIIYKGGFFSQLIVDLAQQRIELNWSCGSIETFAIGNAVKAINL